LPLRTVIRVEDAQPARPTVLDAVEHANALRTERDHADVLHTVGAEVVFRQ
jgi:hypothetical protein